MLLAAGIGATFAYFRAQVGEGANINITSTSGTTDSLTFRTEGGPISIEANQENFGQENGSNQQKGAKAIASLIASDAKEATYNYYVYLQIDKNELTYTKDENTPELVISIKNPDGTYLTELNGFDNTTQVDIKESESVTKQNVTGFDITGYTGLIPIAEGTEITAEKGKQKEETWEVYVTLIYFPNDEQNENTGKQVNGKLIIQKDRAKNTIENNIDLLLAEADKMDPVDDGELIQHTQNEPNSANDNGYRYSGNNPNNFICFGAGSEDYNNGKIETCDLTNQYRIIGIVPVTTANGKQENLIKVIKSEYATKDDLGEDLPSSSLNMVGLYT